MVPSGKGSRIFNSVMVALVALSSVAPAQAGFMSALGDFKKPNIRWGQLEVHPFARLSESYDSNIYLVPKDKADGTRVGGGVLGSFITQGLFGAKLALPISGMHKLEAGYEGEGLLYSKQSKANNAFNQKVNLGYNYAGPRGLSGKLRDQYINTTDPAFSELVTRQQRWSNTIGAEGEYNPENGPAFVGADVSHTNNKYLDPTLGGLLNRYEQAFGVKGGYKVMPKTRVFLAYHRGITHYSAGRKANHKDNFVDVGVEGDIAPKVKGQIQAGLSNRRYDEAPVAGQPTNRNLFSIGTRLTWKPLERDSVNLAVTRSMQESTFANNRFYETSNIGLGLQHKLPYKLTAGANFSAGWDRYPVPGFPTAGTSLLNRRDDLYQQALTLDYDIQEWLRAGVGYLHRSRWSKNFTDQFNYEDHQTNLSLSVTF